MTWKININSDLGAEYGRWRLGPDELTRLVPAVDIACGFHAGDPRIMRRVTARALDGATLEVITLTLCVHGDLPNVLEATRRVRERLVDESIEDVGLTPASAGCTTAAAA